MTTDRFDQTARFVARFDPDGFLTWLVPGLAEHLRFERWLDTRTAPMPGLANQTADTVAELSALRSPGPPWLFLLEFQTEPDPDMFGRLLGELGKFWREHRPDDLPGSRYRLAAAVVNLTGTRGSAPSSRTFDFPVRKIGLRLAAEERHLATESAEDTLAAIGRGETAKSLLAFVPLMTGGGEEGIIHRWLEIASTEPNHRRRSDLGTLALTMADLKPWSGEWHEALKEWNMRESPFIQSWIDLGKKEGIDLGKKEGIDLGKKEGIDLGKKEGIDLGKKEGIDLGKKEGIDLGKKEGRLQTLRQTLRSLLTKRFGQVSAEMLSRIDATADPEVLARAVESILDVSRPEDLLV